jgi:hypothetical protein
MTNLRNLVWFLGRFAGGGFDRVSLGSIGETETEMAPKGVACFNLVVAALVKNQFGTIWLGFKLSLNKRNISCGSCLL